MVSYIKGAADTVINVAYNLTSKAQEQIDLIVRKSVSPIIRPPRTRYDPSKIPQKLVSENESLGSFLRIPLEITNDRNMKIIGSLYHSENIKPTESGFCVFYLHGNASSQKEGQFLIPNLCPYGICVYLFDFVGCGESDGDVVTLGYYEHLDVECLIKELSFRYGFAKFALWGRSMGAATALMTSSSQVTAKVVDSPYSSIEDLIVGIAGLYHIPEVVSMMAIPLIRVIVSSKANYDIRGVRPIDYVNNIDHYLLIGHAKNDDFIPYVQAENIINACTTAKGKEKGLIQLPGEHNSKREASWIREGVELILKSFEISFDDNLCISEYSSLQSLSHHFRSFQDISENNRATD